MKPISFIGINLVWFALAVLPTQAQEGLKDPTRPPDVNVSNENGDAALPILQSVLIAPQRKLAIINGETIKLGGKFGIYRLVRITETSVTLKQGKQTQVLKIHPDLDMKSVPIPANAVKNGRDTSSSQLKNIHLKKGQP